MVTEDEILTLNVLGTELLRLDLVNFCQQELWWKDYWGDLGGRGGKMLLAIRCFNELPFTL